MNRLPRLVRCRAVMVLLGLFSAGQAWATDLKTEVEPALEGIAAKVIAWRRDFHEHPELGNREVRTAKVVADHLRKLGIEVRTGVAHTGVVGTLRGGKPGPVVALRADMDALPVTEPEGLPFASKVKVMWKGQETGVMHACGHDAHVAMLMGAAEALAGIREELPGTVKFIFQPAEESPPAGEEGGAKLMIAEGVLDGRDAPQAIFGLHVLPLLTGNLYVKPEGAMAAADELFITVTGQQTHASMPWRGVDPITVAAQILLALQTITSRQVDLTIAPAVISVGSIHGGNRGNIIPDEVMMSGSIRTFDPDVLARVLARMEEIIAGVVAAFGAEYQFDHSTLPAVVNDAACADIARRAAAGFLGAARVRPERMMGSDDMAYFLQARPGAYFLLGGGNVEKGITHPHHHPKFDFDEDCLGLGVELALRVIEEASR